MKNCLVSLKLFRAFYVSGMSMHHISPSQRVTNMRGCFETSKLFKAFQASFKAHCFQAVCDSSDKRSWKVLRINHIALATGNLAKSQFLYKNIFGIKTSDPVALPDHGVTTVFTELENAKIELLEPLGSKSPIQGFLDKSSIGGMHHICLEVDNIKNAMEDLKKHKIRTLTEKPKIGAHGKPVIFLHPKDCGGVLIELENV